MTTMKLFNRKNSKREDFIQGSPEVTAENISRYLRAFMTTSGITPSATEIEEMTIIQTNENAVEIKLFLEVPGILIGHEGKLVKRLCRSASIFFEKSIKFELLPLRL